MRFELALSALCTMAESWQPQSFPRRRLACRSAIHGPASSACPMVWRGSTRRKPFSRSSEATTSLQPDRFRNHPFQLGRITAQFLYINRFQRETTRFADHARISAPHTARRGIRDLAMWPALRDRSAPRADDGMCHQVLSARRFTPVLPRWKRRLAPTPWSGFAPSPSRACRGGCQQSGHVANYPLRQAMTESRSHPCGSTAPTISPRASFLCRSPSASPESLSEPGSNQRSFSFCPLAPDAETVTNNSRCCRRTAMLPGPAQLFTGSLQQAVFIRASYGRGGRATLLESCILIISKPAGATGAPAHEIALSSNNLRTASS